MPGIGCKHSFLPIEHMFDRVRSPAPAGGGPEGGMVVNRQVAVGHAMLPSTSDSFSSNGLVNDLVPAIDHHSSQGLLTLHPGRVVGLLGSPGFGLTRLGLTMLAGPTMTGPVAYLDVRGWFCPPAAWEAGISPERLVIVRCDDPVSWGRVASTLIEGVPAIFAEVPKGMKEAQLRKLGALARRKNAALILRPLHNSLPSGMTYLRLTAQEVAWRGTNAGHGRLASRRLLFEASGKAVHGMSRFVEVEDHGANALHVVSGLAVAPAGRAVG